MATRYTAEELRHLRESPLVAKPSALPPAEQWMGAPADATRLNSANLRAKRPDSDAPLEQMNRRPQHISRNSKDPAEIILGPPKTSFLSSTSSRNVTKAFDSSDRPSHNENSKDRFNFRSKNGDGDDDRVHRTTLRPKRMEGEGDSEIGWEKVKPRKSFGTEGAERFNGRMGGVDRHRDDRRFKDREEGDGRTQRGFGTFSRDKDGDHDQERDVRRNGLGRGRTESWRDKEDAPSTPRDRNSNGDRLVDRSRGWRDKERDDRDQDRDHRGDRGAGRNDRGDRRWDRNRDDRQQEREPEWMDEPADGKVEAHTQEDFQKWKDSMNKSSTKTPADEETSRADEGSFFNLEKTKVETPLAIETGPDKFFGMWATPTDEHAPVSAIESKKEGAARPKPGGKSSRFTSFFTPQEEAPRRDVEPAPAMPAPPTDVFASLFPASQGNGQGNGQAADVEKVAFQQLLQKLKGQGGGPSTTPPANAQQQPLPPAPAPVLTHNSAPEKQQFQAAPVSESFQQYRPERQERQERQEERPNTSTRNSQHTLQDLLSQRQGGGNQPPVRPEQMLNDLVGQRHNASSQGSFRPEQAQSRNNSEFLMNLMRNTPEPQRIEQTLLRQPPPRPVERGMPLDRQLREQMILEREVELQREAQRERIAAQQRQGRPQAPPGFYDEPRGIAPPHERHGNPPQPTQILQRPPPGLNAMQPNWAQSPSDLGPQQLRQQHIAPPPGLAGGPSRGMPMPQMFPPGFQNMGNFPPPDARMQPPPGFFNAPLPGFMPPGMNGFPGPDAFGGQHFDGRGPPPSAYRRQ